MAPLIYAFAAVLALALFMAAFLFSALLAYPFAWLLKKADDLIQVRATRRAARGRAG